MEQLPEAPHGQDADSGAKIVFDIKNLEGHSLLTGIGARGGEGADGYPQEVRKADCNDSRRVYKRGRGGIRGEGEIEFEVIEPKQVVIPTGPKGKGGSGSTMYVPTWKTYQIKKFQPITALFSGKGGYPNGQDGSLLR